MNLVADSHIILWYLGNPEKLSATALVALEEAEDGDGIGVSVASIPDIWYSTQEGGPSRVDPTQYEQLRTVLTDSEFNVHLLPITERSVPHLDSFSREACPDPFDRFIVATAMEHGLPLVTAVKRITDLGVVPTVW